jgi:hypothetical protein
LEKQRGVFLDLEKCRLTVQISNTRAGWDS